MSNRRDSKDDFVRRNHIREETFLAECEIATGTAQARKAIAVRRAIAKLAGVPESAISASHVFRGQLDQLGMWDSLDTLEFVLQLEKHLGDELPGEVRDRLPGLDDAVRDHPSYSVRDMVTGIVEALRVAEEAGG
jgi:acyl carrier protein